MNVRSISNRMNIALLSLAALACKREEIPGSRINVTLDQVQEAVNRTNRETTPNGNLTLHSVVCDSFAHPTSAATNSAIIPPLAQVIIERNRNISLIIINDPFARPVFTQAIHEALLRGIDRETQLALCTNSNASLGMTILTLSADALRHTVAQFREAWADAAVPATSSVDASCPAPAVELYAGQARLANQTSPALRIPFTGTTTVFIPSVVYHADAGVPTVTATGITVGLVTTADGGFTATLVPTSGVARGTAISIVVNVGDASVQAGTIIVPSAVATGVRPAAPSTTTPTSNPNNDENLSDHGI